MHLQICLLFLGMCNSLLQQCCNKFIPSPKHCGNSIHNHNSPIAIPMPLFPYFSVSAILIGTESTGIIVANDNVMGLLICH